MPLSAELFYLLLYVFFNKSQYKNKNLGVNFMKKEKKFIVTDNMQKVAVDILLLFSLYIEKKNR